MNQEQIEKQLEWLDKERREDKQIIADLKKRVEELEETLEKTGTYVRDVESEVTKVGVRVTKMDSYDEALENHRKEVRKELDAVEKRFKERETAAKTKAEEELSEMRKSVASVEKRFDPLPQLRKELDELKPEFPRYNVMIEEIKQEIKGVYEKIDAKDYAVKVLDEDLTANKKRFADIQGELASVRKRMDEQRVQQELLGETHKKLDTRITEMLMAEDERKTSQQSFMDKITIAQRDVERSFKEWTNRFDDIEQRANTLTEALQAWSEIERSVRTAQGEFEGITEQINRRIHEITEMQRLGEERFRQEWATFKSDDQKRWVNYTLTQEEQSKEVTRRLDRLNDRTTTLEELLQDLQDSVQHSSEQQESLMQALVGVYRDWLTTNERFSESM